MALFYKYAKLLNEIHTFSKSGATKEEIQERYQHLLSLDAEEQKELKAAQEQLVIYSPFVEKELQKPEYGGVYLSGLYFSMGLGTPEQLETYNKALDACIERYNIGEVIKREPGEVKVTYDPDLKQKVAQEFSNYIDLLSKDTEESEDGQFLEEIHKEYATVLAPALKNIIIPLERLNTMAFDFEQLIQVKNNGQMIFSTNTEMSGVICAINFDALENVEMSRKLTIYDKRVFEVIGTIARNHKEANRPGKPITSLTQIYKSMGYLNTPGAKDLAKIEASLRKMNFTGITLNNINVVVPDTEHGGHKNIGEAKTNKKYAAINYSGQFLSVGFIEGSFKGQSTNKAVIIKEEPPLMTYAGAHNNNITTIKTEYLKSPISKTDQALTIEDYLLRSIAQIKKGTRSNHIRFETLLKECRIKTKNPGRVKKKVEEYLMHFINCEWIKSYNLSGDVFEIIY